MRFRLSTVVLLSLVVAVAACAPADEQGPAVEEAATTEADVKAIHRVREAHDAAVNAGVLEAWLAGFAEDAMLMPPNEPPVVGKEAMHSWGQAVFDQFDFEQTTSSDEVEVAGDWAFDRGTYILTPTPTAAGEPAEGAPSERPEVGRELDYAQTGKYLWILKKQADGSWKIACGMWSSNSPPPGM